MSNKRQKNISSKSRQKEALSKPVASRKLGYITICIFIVLGLLVLRLGYLQFIQGGELKEAASRQQATNRIISPSRGAILDCNGKILAQSASVDTVTINPTRIESKNKEKVAKALSEIFELDYEKVLGQVNSESSTETIIKKIEKDKIDKLKKWMDDNEIYSGINIDADYKRYYPYGNLASNLIGFCNTDNDGQEGLELKWNSILSGTPGKIVSIESASSGLIPDKNETYIAAQNGSNITLTIDANVQSIVEKYLKQACIENECEYGGTAIIMNPTNGDIIAMATYPDYDSNNPRTPNEALSKDWDSLSESEQLNSLFGMWRNKCVADTYEPGSTFKIITASVGLEENVVETDTKNDFICVGYEMVNGQRIRCWKYQTTHGYQTLRQSLMNSCNPALMQLGKRIGATTLYKYYRAYGLFDKTGISTSGEANSNFWNLEDVGNVELATMSFGQRFKVTPIQMITAVSSIANNGVLVKPRIVKQIQNTDTNTVTSIEPEEVRQVISSETSHKMMDMLTSVVDEGGGYLAAVNGYTIAGKTGTSEPTPGKDDYVSSFMGIAPSENPELCILVCLYGAKGPNGHFGGTITAPVVSQILTEVLPYLGIPADDLSTSSSSNVTVPDIRNKTIAEAKKVLEGLGITAILPANIDTSSIVTDQVPKPGTSLSINSTVNLYSAENEARTSVQVPNLKDLSLSAAKTTLRNKNLNINATGTGNVISQSPMAGTTVEEGTVITVTLQQKTTDAH